MASCRTTCTTRLPTSPTVRRESLESDRRHSSPGSRSATKCGSISSSESSPRSTACEESENRVTPNLQLPTPKTTSWKLGLGNWELTDSSADFFAVERECHRVNLARYGRFHEIAQVVHADAEQANRPVSGFCLVE